MEIKPYIMRGIDKEMRPIIRTLNRNVEFKEQERKDLIASLAKWANDLPQNPDTEQFDVDFYVTK